MLNLELLHQTCGQSPKSFGDFWISLGGKELVNLFFSKSVVLEGLNSLARINIGGEWVVKSELSRKHIHHDLNGVSVCRSMFILSVLVVGPRQILKSIKYIWTIN